VHADATQVRQVLMNLVTNAADAIGDGPGRIDISTGVMDADRAYLDGTYLAPPLREGRYAYFEVQDNGPGMDTTTSRRVFEPFFTTKFTGRGLGMSSAVGLIRAGLGAVHLATKPGAGATFRVLLPLADAPAGVEPAAPRRAAGGLGPGTVLVAEDEATVRKVVTRSLESFGLTPLLAADGREAIERFIEHQDAIDCVLLDLTMPRLSGREALAAIREVRPNIPVVLMSGFTSEDIGVDLKESGARFLQKPFEVEELRSMLAAVLRRG
jgi:CheY-like chemotaxis protein